MLAGIKFVDKSQADQELEEERKLLKKQKKRLKKEQKKKHAKGKKGNKDRVGAEPSSSGSEEPSPSHAVPASAAAALDSPAAEPATDKVQREDWMTKSFPKASDLVALPEDEAAKQKAAEEQAKAALPKVGLIQSSSKPAGETRPGRVGDGGASWRLKALARAKAQAGDASDPNFGRKVGDIVSEQWGSLSELTAGLTNTRAAHARAHLLAAKDRQNAAQDAAEPSSPTQPDRSQDRGDPSRGGARGDSRGARGSEKGRDGARQPRGEASHYLEDVKSSRAQMRRPSDSSSLSWRRSKPESRDRDSTEHRQTDRTKPASDREHSTRSSDHDERQRRGGHEHAQSTDRHASDQSQQQIHTDTDRRDQPRDRQERDPTQTRDSSARPKREPEQDNNQRRPPARRSVVNPNSKQAELLASVASEMNIFSNDGSFMERFAAKHAGESGRGSEEDAQPSGAADAAELSLSGGSNKATAAELRARLMRGKAPSLTVGPKPAQDSDAANSGAAALGSKAQSVQLSGLDSRGRAVPGAFGRALAGEGAPEGGRKPKRVQRFDDGERQRYFADDDKQKLSDLVAQQRYEGAADMDANLADNIVRKGKRFRENELDADAEYDVDGGLDMYESRKKKGTKEQQQKRDRSAQIADHRRSTQALDRCNLCFGSAARQRHLTISLGQTAYLALPAKGRLVPGHSVIVPTEHVASSRQVDEQVWTEMRNFKKCLLQMHMAQGMDVIFIETAMRLGDTRSHAVVDCIPVPPAVAAKAPLYFKKGIDDAESEWSQHHAKRMIDTSGKGLKGSIPANFPYFHVEFNLVKGFVHVIDDETKFDPQFGRSILIGLLGLPAEDMHRRAKTESNSMQQHWVADFAKQWDKYDWTKQLG